MLNPADSELLAGLFGEETGAFRHRMGLRPLPRGEFYAPTDEAVAVRSEKAGILDGPDGGDYLLTTDQGAAAFGEFAALLPSLGVEDGQSDLEAWTRTVALRLEPDFLLLRPPRWELAWAAVCFPTRWSLEGKGGHPLGEIHAVVPGLNEELGRKVAVFFDRLAPDAEGGWGRANWGLATSVQRNQHPRLPLAPLSEDWPLERAWLRVEAQHFFKLPVTGAIAFGIRIRHFALPEVLAEAGGALGRGLRDQLRTMPEAVAAYKGIPPGWWRRLET